MKKFVIFVSTLDCSNHVRRRLNISIFLSLCHYLFLHSSTIHCISFFFYLCLINSLMVVFLNIHSLSSSFRPFILIIFSCPDDYKKINDHQYARKTLEGVLVMCLRTQFADLREDVHFSIKCKDEVLILFVMIFFPSFFISSVFFKSNHFTSSRSRSIIFYRFLK